MLLSLSSLSRLERLSLLVPGLDLQHLHSLGSLPSLRRCSIGDAFHVYSLVDAAGLFSLQRLTCLKLLSVQHDSTTLSSEKLAACRQAIAPLGKLRNLRRLAFDTRSFVVDDSIFSAFSQLTGLTSLSVRCFSLSHPIQGHLPLLQRLVVDEVITQTQLLQTLLPWQPSAALQTLMDDCFEMSVGASDDVAAAAQAADLLQASQILGRTSVYWDSISLFPEAEGVRVRPWDVCRGLAPLAGLVKHMILDSMGRDEKMGAEWVALSTCFPQLERLTLRYCKLDNSFLGCVVSGLQHLSDLDVECREVNNECWLGLAATRGHPLRVRCAVDETPVQRCLDLQDKVFHTVYLQFGGFWS